MRKTFAALVAIMLAAAPAMAQGHHGARADSSRGMGMLQGQSGMMQGGMMQMMQSGMMMGMAMGPGMVLRLQESLGLTEDQVTELETLRDSAQSTMRQHMMQGMQVMHAASEQLGSDSPDLDAYEARVREATNHMVQAHTAMARAAVEARQVLTPEQRERLALARSMMKEMRQGMMGGGMMNRGMMDRGMMNQGGGASPDG
ncbi:MAG: Spy/CpxP family protein refolding chaperone [Longimicrobiales bacterium]